MEDDNNTASKLIEIKEILERVKKHYVLDKIQDNLLLNYITNLQQAVKNTKETADDMLYELNEENEKLKSRIEKAVEYVEQHKFNKFGDIDCGEAEAIIDILNSKE